MVANAISQSLRSVYLNIVDLVDAANSGTVLEKTFETAEELKEYTMATRKIFPLDDAKDNGLLSQFLLKIF